LKKLHDGEATPSTKVVAAPAAAVAPIAPLNRKALFGTLPISVRSEETRKLLEKAIDQYENVLLDMSIDTAHRAALKDSRSLWHLQCGHTPPITADRCQKPCNALESSLPKPLLRSSFWSIGWLTSSVATNIAAIGAMNDLLAHFPNDKHVLYLTSEWLYVQAAGITIARYA
jgi:hypothetical protein